jgi:molecular chaperone GrpE
MEKERKQESRKDKNCQCKDDIVNLKKQNDEYLEGWQRSQADYANLKRRVEEDITRIAKFASADLITKLLPVMDNFRRAANHVPENLKDENWVQGVQQVEKQLDEILASEGLKKIDSLGKEFNPEEAEAVGFEDNKKFKDGQVCEVLEDGYLLNEKVIRTAKVKICKK